MRAVRGDQLVVRGHRSGQPDRRGEVMEVRGPDGSPPYFVRWDDNGHTTLYFPGSDALVEPMHRDGAAAGTEGSDEEVAR
ncbi:MAG: DUF1918 domain-containing protein [Acidimicrobiia bacterium]